LKKITLPEMLDVKRDFTMMIDYALIDVVFKNGNYFIEREDEYKDFERLKKSLSRAMIVKLKAKREKSYSDEVVGFSSKVGDLEG